MNAKISVTTRCNAMCKTCPVWTYPGFDMKLEDFKTIFDKLNESEKINKIMLSNTGEMYLHPDHVEMFKYVEEKKKKHISLTTNAALMDYVPAIDCLVISFNGGDKTAYEQTTRLDFDAVTANIRRHYEEFYEKLSGKALEIHCLIWKGNADSEARIIETWKDFPGHIRLSFKYDNQFGDDLTLDEFKRPGRIACNYIDQLSIWPDGRVVSCPHDFKGETNWGNILYDSVNDLLWNKGRVMKRADHDDLNFSGLCEKCNYNTPETDRVRYIK